MYIFLIARKRSSIFYLLNTFTFALASSVLPPDVATTLYVPASFSSAYKIFKFPLPKRVNLVDPDGMILPSLYQSYVTESALSAKASSIVLRPHFKLMSLGFPKK